MIIQQRDYLQLKEFISTDIISEKLEILLNSNLQVIIVQEEKNTLEKFFLLSHFLPTYRHTVNRVRKALWPRPKLIHD